MPFHTYELTDPRNGAEPKDGEEVYVGVTDDIIRRFMQHLTCQDTGEHQQEKNTWILGLRAERLLPALKIRETSEERAVAEDRETYWIRHHQARGARVLNIRKRDRSLDQRVIGQVVEEDRASDSRGISGDELLDMAMKNPFLREFLPKLLSGEIEFGAIGDPN